MEKIYWDSNCFLAILKNENGRADVCVQILQEAKKSKLLLVTSTATLAEVTTASRKQKIPATQREKVKIFFADNPIEIVGLTREIAETARDIIWSHNLKPIDACHVATAISLRLEKFHTFDRGLIKKSGQVGNPKLIIEEPKYISSKQNNH